MLQRIQTLFLVLAAIVSIVVFFLPLATFSVSGQSLTAGSFFYEFDIFILGVKNMQGTYPENISGIVNMLMYIILLAAIVILTVSTIFAYKNRVLQMKLCRFNLILNIVFVVLILYLPGTLEQKLTTMQVDLVLVNYKVGVFLQLAVVVLVFLANKFIKKDENLVRAADRLR